MKFKDSWKIVIPCGIAGAVNGLFGAGGGMLLVPLLTLLANMAEEEIFPVSISVILPICLISLLFRPMFILPALQEGLPYLIGSIPGGLLTMKLSGKIPVTWLHKTLGILILWGGIRYLC